MMIVKNEQQTLPRLAASLRGHIDYWTVVDTGSADTTMAIAREVFDYAPGQVIQTEWKGYSACRNVALVAAEAHTDWLLHMDADETFHGHMPTQINTDDSLVRVEAEERHGSLRFFRPRLVRSGMGAAWVGRAHEYLTVNDIPVDSTGLRTDDFYVEHYGDGGNRAGKFQREIELLDADWSEDPNNSRTAFYLGRTYDDLGRYGEAVVWYRHRLTMTGWDEETFYAGYRLGVCLLHLAAKDEGCGVLWRAWGQRPTRAEPLVALAEHYRQQNQWILAWQAVSLAFKYCGAQPDGPALFFNGLFVDTTATEWRAAYEGSIAAWYVGEINRGRELTDFLLDHSDLPPDIAANVVNNSAFYGAKTNGTLGKT